jgi:hypothetical protein
MGLKGALLSIGLCFFSLSSFGDDPKSSPPQIILNDIFFQPTLRVIEGGQGGFDPLQWSLGAKTNFASWVDVQADIGASQLLYLPYWSQNQYTDPVALLDFVGTLHTVFGDVYAGETLVPWGLEGQMKEDQLWLPRDLLYENGAFPLRDLGVGLKTELNGFYMNVMVHNGEGGAIGNEDNRMFMTAQWGLMSGNNFNMGFSFTAGRVAPPLVANEIHLRGGNAFLAFNLSFLNIQAEGSYLQSISNPQTVDTFAFHTDAEIPLSDHVNLIGRYEQYNPNTRVTSNIETRVYGGGEIHSKNNVSRVFLLGVLNNDTQIPNPGNEIRLMWRITPNFD